MAQHVINLGGASRTLKFTTFAVYELEDELDVSTIEQDFFLKPSMRKIVAMIWAALLHSNPRLTPRIVADWLDKEGKDKMLEYYQAAVNAYLELTQDEDDSEKKA